VPVKVFVVGVVVVMGASSSPPPKEANTIPSRSAADRAAEIVSNASAGAASKASELP